MQNNHFRFLDLLPELRNIVYSYVLADEAAPQLPLLEAHKYVPSAAITSVCRSLRNETLLWHQEATKRFYPKRKFSLHATVPNTSNPNFQQSLDNTLKNLDKAQAPGLRRLDLVEQYGPVRVTHSFEVTGATRVAVSHRVETAAEADADSWVQQAMQRVADGSAKGLLAAAKEAQIPFYCAQDPETLDVRNIYCAWLKPFGVIIKASGQMAE